MDDWDNVDDCALKLNIYAAPTNNEQKVTTTTINEDEWDVPLITTASAAPPSTHSRIFTEDREPVILILVDLTVLSNGSIHNQFDKHRYKPYTIHCVTTSKVMLLCVSYIISAKHIKRFLRIHP